ncbi:hypothetical protein Pelo_18216 [Pelomyxa schiedti]|nr:hypothetical protein Pelo_18216 [Pelomyxa schiedti]
MPRQEVSDRVSFFFNNLNSDEVILCEDWVQASNVVVEVTVFQCEESWATKRLAVLSSTRFRAQDIEGVRAALMFKKNDSARSFVLTVQKSESALQRLFSQMLKVEPSVIIQVEEGFTDAPVMPLKTCHETIHGVWQMSESLFCVSGPRPMLEIWDINNTGGGAMGCVDVGCPSPLDHWDSVFFEGGLMFTSTTPVARKSPEKMETRIEATDPTTRTPILSLALNVVPLPRQSSYNEIERGGFIHTTFLKHAVWGDIFVSKPESSTPAKKLHILYLLIDILAQLHFQERIAATSDLQEAVAICVQSAYESQLEKDKEKVLKVLNIWKERKIYSSDIIQQMTASFGRSKSHNDGLSEHPIHTHQPLHCQIPSVPVPPVPLPASSVPAVSPPCEPPSRPQAEPTTIPAVNPAIQQDLVENRRKSSYTLHSPINAMNLPIISFDPPGVLAKDALLVVKDGLLLLNMIEEETKRTQLRKEMDTAKEAEKGTKKETLKEAEPGAGIEAETGPTAEIEIVTRVTKETEKKTAIGKGTKTGIETESVTASETGNLPGTGTGVPMTATGIPVVPVGHHHRPGIRTAEDPLMVTGGLDGTSDISFAGPHQRGWYIPSFPQCVLLTLLTTINTQEAAEHVIPHAFMASTAFYPRGGN